MTGFVLLLTAIAFAISAGIEYWIVSSSEVLRRWYTSDAKRDKLLAMAVSIAISLFFGALVGTGAGGGVYTGMVIMLSTGLGFATNTMTYRFFEGLGKVVRTIKSWKATVKERPEWMLDLMALGKAIFSVACITGRGIRYLIRGATWAMNGPEKIRAQYRKQRIDHRLPWEKKVPTI